ncbi:MAG: cupin domain-containing protein [Bacillota bacterium]
MLGDVVRQLRRAKGLTLQQVSELTGLSAAFISQVENNQANPTLSSLRKIASAVGTSVFALLAQGELGEAACVRIPRDHRRSFVAPGFNTTFELASASHPGAKIQAVWVELEPGMETCDEPMCHGPWDAEEWALVIEGEVDLEAGTEGCRLQAGDAVHFRPAVPHKYRNTGKTRARFICIMCPPTF